MDVRLVRGNERVAGDPTPGMVREQAIAIPGLWAGVVRTEAGSVSGWHQHGDHDTAVYVLSGSVIIEWGRGGREMVEAGPGDFLHIPTRTVHRESNTGDREAAAVVVRTGAGEAVVNVEGPDADG